MNIQRLYFPEKNQCQTQEIELDETLQAGEALIQNRLSLIGSAEESALFCGRSSNATESRALPSHPQGAVVGKVLASNGAIPAGTRVVYNGFRATHNKVNEQDLLPLPDEISDERAAFIPFVARALSAPRLVPNRIGEHVVVVGMGLTGNLCAQLYAQSGAGRVACADHSEARLEKARTCGLIETYDLSQKSLPEWVSALGPRGAELVIEADGRAENLEAAIHAVAEKGIVALLEKPSEASGFNPFSAVYKKGVMLVGARQSNIPSETLHSDKQLLLEWLRWNKLKVDPLITQTMHFTEANSAYEGLRDRAGEFTGIIIHY